MASYMDNWMKDTTKHHYALMGHLRTDFLPASGTWLSNANKFVPIAGDLLHLSGGNVYYDTGEGHFIRSGKADDLGRRHKEHAKGSLLNAEEPLLFYKTYPDKNKTNGSLAKGIFQNLVM